MAYAHYLRRPPVISWDAWRKIMYDTLQVFDYIHNELGITLVSPNGGVPIISSDKILFNGGKQPVGEWTTTEEIKIPWPADHAGMSDPDPNPIGVKTAGRWFNGTLLKQRVAPCEGKAYGDGSYEIAGMSRVRVKGYTEPDAAGRLLESCATGYRPYDIAVTAFYCIVKHHVPECAVSSDGHEKDWIDAIFICHNVLGYTLESPLRID